MIIFDKERLERLRLKALRPDYDKDAGWYLFFERYSQNGALGTEDARYADAYAAMLEGLEPVIDEDELIVGKPRHPLNEEQKRGADRIREIAGTLAVPHMESHMAVDYELLLSLGLSGLRKQLTHRISDARTEKERSFYTVCCASLASVSDFSHRYAAKARAMSESCPDRERRDELLELARVCEKVPENPAGTFYEAVQSVHFLTYCLTLDPFSWYSLPQYQLGRPDRYLRRFYEKDLREGRITREGAQFLLDLLGIQINHRVPRGLSSGYMVGGRNPDGSLTVNDLTEMGMQVVDDIRLVYPSVGFCYTADTPDPYLDLACRILSHGRSHPAIFNDDLITEGLLSYGMEAKYARNYIHSTCVEITPIGASSCWVASPYTNMPQILLDLMDRDYPGFESLFDAYLARLSDIIRDNCRDMLNLRDVCRKTSRKPLLSCFVDSCLDRATDIDDLGARYNWIMPSFVGVGNTVDSLFAIRNLVFEEKRIALPELKSILENDFDGREDILRLLDSYPKYGNDIPEVDSLYGRITDFIVKECRQYRKEEEGFRLVPSVFCWVMHEAFGRETVATPDGRRAGFPLGDGSGPCQGRERKGPTASVLSSTSWDHSQMIGGVAVNLKFSKKTFGEDSRDRIKALIRAYILRGGFELQINVLDADTLRAAQQTPELYQDLVVRIGGYSDYFVSLSPEMQAEVLLRTEHSI